MAKDNKPVVGRRECMYCGTFMGDAPGVNGVTHGVCNSSTCRQKLKKDMGE